MKAGTSSSLSILLVALTLPVVEVLFLVAAIVSPDPDGEVGRRLFPSGICCRRMVGFSRGLSSNPVATTVILISPV